LPSSSPKDNRRGELEVKKLNSKHAPSVPAPKPESKNLRTIRQYSTKNSKLCEFENKKLIHFIIFTYIKLPPSRQGIFPELCIFSRFRRVTRNATPAAIPASDKPKRRPDTVKPVKINVWQKAEPTHKNHRKSLQYAEYAPDLPTQP